MVVASKRRELYFARSPLPYQSFFRKPRYFYWAQVVDYFPWTPPPPPGVPVYIGPEGQVACFFPLAIFPRPPLLVSLPDGSPGPAPVETPPPQPGVVGVGGGVFWGWGWVVGGGLKARGDGLFQGVLASLR